MSAVNTDSFRISDRFYVLRDPESIETQGNLQNWVTLVLIVHLVTIATFLKLAEIYHPRLLHNPDKIAIMLMLTPPPTQTLGLGSAGRPGQVAARKTPGTKAPAAHMAPAHPVHQLEAAKTPDQPRLQNLLPTLNTPSPIWSAPQAPEPQKLAGGAPTATTDVVGNAGSIPGGQGQGSGAGTGQGGTASAGTGDIAPYRKYLLTKLSRRWRPTVSPVDVILLLQIGKNGELLASDIFKSTGSKKAAREALDAARAMSYPPLPDWFNGRSLIFRIELIAAGAQ